ncbi:MAG: hypothetical protein B0D92_05245 [Spirochaeta sp. LUC14_002_19_P3]|nr:MAG: hypothetical protein B0D92_05245 [Spirochaeta sp. LUC14_002_19_P3]
MSNNPPPFCPKCIHYYVTWDSAFPNGCRIFGIKSRMLPSAEVRSANNRDCPAYELNPNVK